VLFGIAATAIVGAGELRERTVPGVLARERSFFGTHVVRRIGDQYGTLHAFMHGRTLHGAQHSEPALRNRPLTYYAFDGPLGELFNATFTRATPARVGVVGLGVGSTAAYARVGDRFTFFEIDPTVARMARDTTLFTYLHDAPSTTSIVLGDGRRSLAKEPAGSFDLLLIDAFSSDAIPVHLATREAVALYLGRLREGGLLAFHVSNRYLELDAVLAAIADEAGLVARERTDLGANSGSWVLSTRHLRSQWVVLARDAADVALLDDRWRSYSRLSHLRGWTDDYSNLAASFAWGRRTVNTVADPIAVTAAPDTATPDASAPATTAPHEPSRDRGRRAPR
jgi:protein-L-isoaspartate O-methyltransferase